MKKVWTAVALLVILPGWTLGQRIGTTHSSASGPKVVTHASRAAHVEPDPKWTPTQVVQFQLEALKDNDSLGKDSGIQGAFAFASPANRASIGPVERFAEIVHNPLYQPLLNHRRMRLDPVQIEGRIAVQRATVWDADGRRAVYLFTLSLQWDGQYAGCWMTNAVVRLASEPTAMV